MVLVFSPSSLWSRHFITSYEKNRQRFFVRQRSIFWSIFEASGIPLFCLQLIKGRNSNVTIVIIKKHCGRQRLRHWWQNVLHRSWPQLLLSSSPCATLEKIYVLLVRSAVTKSTEEMTASFAMPDLSRALLKPPRVICARLDNTLLKTELLDVSCVSLGHSQEIFKTLQASNWPRFNKYSDAVVATFFGIIFVVTIVRRRMDPFIF